MHPVLFSIGDFELHLYGVLIALGTILAVAIATKWGKEEGFDKDLFTDLGFWSIVAAVAGARLEYLRVNWSAFANADLATMLNVRDGGLVFYGGFIGTLVAFAIILGRKKVKPLKVLDILAPMVPFGLVFGRMGCFFAGCCYGMETDLPWGIEFPVVEHSRAPSGVHLHPTQLYAVGYSAALFGFLYWVRQRKVFDGQVILSFLTIYPVLRSLNEVVRGDLQRGYVIEGVLTNAQTISLAIALVAAVGWVVLLKKHRARVAKAG